MENTEVTEVPSFREELTKQFEAVEAPAPANPGLDTSAPPPPSLAPTPTPLTAAAPPAGQKPGEDPAQDAKDVAALKAAEAANRPIPERLKEKWGQTWDKLEPAVKEQFHAYESDIGRLAFKYGKGAKNWEEVSKAAAPYESMLRQEGATLQGAVGNLLETARILRQGAPEQKLALVQAMCKNFGINLGALTGQAAEASSAAPSSAPGLSPELLDRIANIERTVLTRDAETVHNTREQVNSELQTFLGDPANVYLQEPGYLDTMSALISSGKAVDLKSAYEQAAWLHDRPRELEIAKRHAQRIQSSAAAASVAKTAAVSVNGTSTGTPRLDTSKMTLREALEASFDGTLN